VHGRLDQLYQKRMCRSEVGNRPLLCLFPFYGKGLMQSTTPCQTRQNLLALRVYVWVCGYVCGAL
jgi:hypothetical protein